MNSNKAREFFSAYFEDSLDSGLRQAFERTLRVDAGLQAEYRAFEQTMASLGTMKSAEIAIPDDLTERISARLDLHLFEQKQARKSPLLVFWKPLAVAGLAAVALVGTLLTLNSDRQSGPVEGGLVPSGLNPPPAPSPEADSHTLKLESPDGKARTVKVTNFLTGDSVAEFKVEAGEDASIQLKNSGTQIGFSKIETSPDGSVLFVAVPSKTALRTDHAQDATIRGAAMRLSAQYGRPVVLLCKDPLHALTVAESTHVDALAGARSVFGEGFAVELRSDGFLWVQQH